MELVNIIIPETKHLVVAPMGDIQWAGKHGSTAESHLKRHIESVMETFDDVLFLGMGDYIDFASPSNRARLLAANVYDTAQEVLEEAACSLVDEVYEKFLKPTEGRWIGLLEGHHFYEFDGRTTDLILAEKLKTRCLGTSAYVHLDGPDVTLLATHGTGGGILPGNGLNKLYHWSGGLVGADVYLMGHSTKLACAVQSRPFPRWNKPVPDLSHRDIRLVNTGGFSRSNVPGSRRGNIVRGDYAEQRMLTPAPLTAPLVHVYPNRTYQEDRVRVEI